MWDGNEVWLLTAGGATFAAFPNWYATLFSGFYLPLFLILAALIFRGVAFEFRGKRAFPAWRAGLGPRDLLGKPVIPALLWGVAFANMLRGVPIGAARVLPGFLLQPSQPLCAPRRGHDIAAVRSARCGLRLTEDH